MWTNRVNYNVLGTIARITIRITGCCYLVNEWMKMTQWELNQPERQDTTILATAVRLCSHSSGTVNWRHQFRRRSLGGSSDGKCVYKFAFPFFQDFYEWIRTEWRQKKIKSRWETTLIHWNVFIHEKISCVLFECKVSTR